MDMLMAGMSSINQKKNNCFMRKYLKQDISQYFEWHGKLYDINYIYRFKYELSNYLVPYCPMVPIKPTISNSNVMEVTDCIYSNRRHTCRYKCSISSSAFNNYQRQYRCFDRCYIQDDVTDFLEVNLLHPTKVSHISLMGSIATVDVFPKDYKCYFRKGSRGGTSSNYSTKKTASHIFVVSDEKAASWVTEFELYYRSVTTSKWVFVSTFLGNCNGYDVKLVDLHPFYNATHGIYTQYLRIRPVQHHNQPRLLVSIYQYHDETSSDVCTTMSTTSTAAEEIPTVRYVVDNNNACQSYGKCRDGFTKRVLRRYRWGDKNLQVKKRRSWQRIAKEDMRG